jgi:hypothetical protein
LKLGSVNLFIQISSLLPVDVKQELNVVENLFFKTSVETNQNDAEQKKPNVSQDLLCFEVEHDHQEAESKLSPTHNSSKFDRLENEHKAFLVSYLDGQLDSQTSDKQKVKTSTSNETIEHLDKMKTKNGSLLNNKKAIMKSNTSHVLRNKKCY